MPTFSYSARPAAGGEMQTGELSLATKDEVFAHLHRQKLIPVSVREKKKEFSITFGTGITTRDIVIFTRQFATMINSGLPLFIAGGGASLGGLRLGGGSEPLRERANVQGSSFGGS